MPPIQTSLDFKIKVDQASAQQHAVATAQLRQQYESLVQTGQKLHDGFLVQGQAANRLHAQIANLNDDYRAGKISLVQYENENARLTAELKKADSAFGGTTQAIRETDSAIKGFYKTVKTEGPIAESAVDPAKAALTAQRAQLRSLQQSGSAVSAVGRGISVLGPSVLPVTGPTAQVLQAVHGVELLQMEFPKLTEKMMGASTQTMIAAAAVGVFVAAVTLVAIETNKAVKATRQAVLGQIDAVKKFYEESTGATIEDTHKKLQSLQKERQQLKQTQDAIEKSRTNYEKGNSKLVSTFVILGDKLGIANAGWEDYGNALGDVNKKIEENKDATELWTQKLRESDLAARAAASGTEVHNAWTRATEDTQHFLDDQEKLHELYKLSSDDLKKQLEETASQLRAMESSAGLGQLIRGFNEAVESGTSFMGIPHLVASDLEKLGQALLDQGDPMGQLILNYVNLRHEYDLMTSSTVAAAIAANDLALANKIFTEYVQEQAGVDAARLLASQREQEDALRKRVQDLADFYADMADLDTKYYDDRAGLLDDIAADLQDIDQKRIDEIKDYNKESRRLAQDHKDAILQIQRDTERDYLDAARNRDTAGALAALRSGERQLDDEQRGYEKEKKRRDEDQRDQIRQLELERREKLKADRQALRDLETQHRKEHAAKEAAFRQQLQREDEQRRIAAQRQQQDFQREDQARLAHYGIVEGNLDTHLKNIETAYMRHLASLEAIAGGGAVGSPAVSGGTRLPTAYAAGGTPPLGRRVTVGEARPETAVFASGRRQIIGAGGRETAMFTEPVRIYPNADAGMGININVGGIRIQAQGGSARDLARKFSQAEFNSYLANAIDAYAGRA